MLQRLQIAFRLRGNLQLMARELHRLTRLSAAVDNDFVIFLASASDGYQERFVQFCGNRAAPLAIDLPKQSLSAAEFDRAAAYFSKYGDCLTESQMLDEEGNETGMQVSFTMHFGQDAVRAARVGLDVLTTVLQLPEDSRMRVERGYQ